MDKYNDFGHFQNQNQKKKKQKKVREKIYATIHLIRFFFLLNITQTLSFPHLKCLFVCVSWYGNCFFFYWLLEPHTKLLWLSLLLWWWWWWLCDYFVCMDVCTFIAYIHTFLFCLYVCLAACFFFFFFFG